MKRVNSDFTINLPASIAGRELQSGDSVTIKIYTVNRNNFYNYTYEDCTIPETLQVASQWLDGMESGVVYMQVTAHVTDETMPDGYYDEAEEYTTEYFWIQPSKASVITEIVVKELNDKIEENAADIAENTAAINSLDERVNANSADIFTLQGDVGTLQSAVSNLENDLDSNYYTETEVDNLLAAKQDTLTFDSTPTENSTNPVTSGGIKTYVDNAASSVNNTFIVNFTYDGETDQMTADKSCADIYAAWNSGKAVIGVTDVDLDELNWSQLILTHVKENESVIFSIAFTNHIVNYTSLSWNGYTYGIHYTELSPLRSPEFIDVPKAPTAAAGTDTTQIATTQFVNTAVSGKADATAVYTKSETDTALAAKQNTLTFDSTPTANSTNPVTSGGVYTALSNIDLSDYYTKSETNTALAAKADASAVYTKSETDTALAAKADASAVYTKSETDTALAAKQNTLTFDSTPTENSTNPVTSGGIYTALNNIDLSSKADLVDGKVPSSQLPSYVDDVLEYNGVSNFPSEGEAGKIYVDTSTNKTYRWGGSAYAEISESLALGTTSSTAFAGDRGLALETAMATKADASSVYTKTEIDEGNQVVSTALNRLNSGKADASSVYTKSEVDTALGNKQNTLTFDSTPTANSTNPVTSGGVYTALGDISTALSTIIGNNS